MLILTNKKTQKDIIQLPTNPDNPPNYNYMSLVIGAMQKVVIKNLVEHLDTRIDTTTKIVQQTL